MLCMPLLTVDSYRCLPWEGILSISLTFAIVFKTIWNTLHSSLFIFIVSSHSWREHNSVTKWGDVFLSSAYGGGSYFLLGIIASLRPLVKLEMFKKRTKKFIRHPSDWYVKIKYNRWKPRGIKNSMCRRFKGQILMPSIGLGSNKNTKYMLPGGFWKFLVHSINELEVLLMCNRSHCAEDCSQCLLRELQSHHGWSSPSGRQGHHSQCQAEQWRKWIDILCAHYIGVSETTKFCHMAKIDKMIILSHLCYLQLCAHSFLFFKNWDVIWHTLY